MTGTQPGTDGGAGHPGAAAVTQADMDAYWAAVTAADEHQAYRTAAGSLERGVSLENVLRGLVVGSQLRVGVLWSENAMTVAQEHAATAVSERVVRRLAQSVPPVTSGPAVTVACVEREWHALPALVVSLVLRERGCRVTYLGASASRELLASSILDTGPRAVLLSASLTSSLLRVRRQVETVRGSGTPVVLGGRAFDAAGVRAARLGATAYAADPAAVAALLPTLPMSVPPAPPLRHPGAAEASVIAAEAESVCRDVVATLGDTLDLEQDTADLPLDDWRVVVTTFVPHVVDCLAGALLTEDPGVLTRDLAWLTEVLARRDAPESTVRAVVSALVLRLQQHPEAVRLLAV